MHLVYVHNLPDMIWLTFKQNEVSRYFLLPQVQKQLYSGYPDCFNGMVCTNMGAVYTLKYSAQP